MSWNTFKTKLLDAWGKLRHDRKALLKEERNHLISRVQQRYGWARDKAEIAVDEWTKAMRSSGRLPGQPGA